MIDLAEKRVQKLTDKGIEHLQGGRYHEALQVAAELEDAKGPLSFYIAGEAYSGLNDIKTAIATMKRGVLIKPTVWWNWFYLGVYLNRLQKHDQALAAYNQALLCPVVDADMVRANMGIVAIECRDYDSALTYLDGVTKPDLRWAVDGSRVLALEGVGRIAEAAQLAEQFLKERPEGDGEYSKRVGYIAAALARIRLRQGQCKEEVRNFLFLCLDEYGCSCEVLREIRCLKELRYSQSSKHYRLVIRSTLPVGHPWYREARGYLMAYDVVSDSESDALDMINEFESASGAESIELMEYKIIEERPQDPMGIYAFSEKFF